MSDAGASQNRISKDPSEMKFRDMNMLQKGIFVCKAMVFLISFGFAFPNIFTD